MLEISMDIKILSDILELTQQTTQTNINCLNLCF